MRVLIPLALLGSFVFCSASSDDAHSFEWAGLFHVEDYDKITWLAQKVDGDYIDPSMMIAIIASDGEEEAVLEVYVDDTQQVPEDIVYSWSYNPYIICPYFVRFNASNWRTFNFITFGYIFV